MKENYYNYNQHKTHNAHKLETFLTIVKAVSVLGAAYLTYKKRETIQSGIQTAKDKTVEASNKITQSVKDTTSQFQDYIHNKTGDANAAVTSLTSQIEDKYHQLEGESKESYAKALKTLSEKINSLSEAASHEAQVVAQNSTKVTGSAVASGHTTDSANKGFDNHKNH